MRKTDRIKNTAYYEYVNVNPKGKYSGDCVIRAIAYATSQTWEQTIRELTELGIKKGLVCNDPKLYPKYLEQKGFKQMNEPRDNYNKKMSIKEWVNDWQFNSGMIVANVGSHHVTCIDSGVVKDIWDCSGDLLHKFWVKF